MKQISFIDSAIIKVKGGRGGDGSKSFHREKYVNYGGPSGGNGGNGGSVFLVATNNENTLLEYKGRNTITGENAQPGSTKNMTGKNGKSRYISVPVGTQVYINDKLVTDLSYDGQIYLVSKGGKGGRGNKSFKSSKNLVPELFELGEDPKFIELKLELKVLADVGLLGFPNAGKSTFLSVVSNAKPKIADYEFTTLVPQLGLIKHNITDFVITDLPGLIEGASLNKGMGIQFLKHLSRTKVILHLVDAQRGDWKKRYDDLRFELKNYSEKMINLEEIILISKSEDLDEEMKETIANEFPTKVYFISSITKEGISELLNVLASTIKKIKDDAELELDYKMNNEEFVYIKHKDEEDNWKIRIENGIYIINGKYPEYWGNRIPFDSKENFRRIFMKLKSKGIIKQLEDMGIDSGDVVMIENSPYTFEWN